MDPHIKAGRESIQPTDSQGEGKSPPVTVSKSSSIFPGRKLSLTTAAEKFSQAGRCFSAFLKSTVSSVRAPIAAKLDAFKRENTFKSYARAPLDKLLMMKNKGGEPTADCKRLRHHFEVLLRRTAPFLEQYTFGGKFDDQRIEEMVEQFANDPRFKDQNKVELKALLKNLAEFIKNNPEFLKVTENVGQRKLAVQLGNMPKELRGQIRDALVIMLRNDETKTVDFAQDVMVRAGGTDRTVRLNEADRTRSRKEINTKGISMRASDDALSVKKQLGMEDRPVRKKAKEGLSPVDRAAAYFSPENIHGSTGIIPMLDNLFKIANSWQAEEQMAKAKEQLMEGVANPEEVRAVLDTLTEFPTKILLGNLLKAATAVRDILNENGEDLKKRIDVDPRQFGIRVIELIGQKGLSDLKPMASIILDQLKKAGDFEGKLQIAEQQCKVYQVLSPRAEALFDQFKADAQAKLGPKVAPALEGLELIPTVVQLDRAVEAADELVKRLSDPTYSSKFTQAGFKESALLANTQGRGHIISFGTPILAAALRATADITENRLEAIRDYCKRVAEGFTLLQENAGDLSLAPLPDMNWEAIGSQVNTKLAQNPEGLAIAQGFVKSAQEQGVTTQQDLIQFVAAETNRIDIPNPKEFYMFPSSMLEKKTQIAGMDHDTKLVRDLLNQEVKRAVPITEEELDQVANSVRAQLALEAEKSEAGLRKIITTVQSFQDLLSAFSKELQKDVNALADQIEGKAQLPQNELDALIDRIFDKVNGHFSDARIEGLLKGSNMSPEDREMFFALFEQASINLHKFLKGDAADAATLRSRSPEAQEGLDWREQQPFDNPPRSVVPKNAVPILREIAGDIQGLAFQPAIVDMQNVSLHFPEYADHYLTNLTTYMKDEMARASQVEGDEYAL